MDAKQLIKELQTIPKMIKTLEEDRQVTLSLAYSPSRYSDTRVQTSKTNAQETKTVAYLDRSDYMLKHIEQLHEKRQRLLEYVYKVDGLNLVLVLLAVVNAETLAEAQEHLDIGQTKFFKLKKRSNGRIR